MDIEWRKVAWCLKSASRDDNEIYKLWHRFSKKSISKYDETSAHATWERGKDDVWTSAYTEGYLANSILYELFIYLPTKEEHNGETNTSHRVLPYITKVKIIRANTDQSSSISHYGVSFIHENILLQRRFNSLIVEMKDQFYAERTPEIGLNFALGGQNTSTTGTGPNC